MTNDIKVGQVWTDGGRDVLVTSVFGGRVYFRDRYGLEISDMLERAFLTKHTALHESVDVSTTDDYHDKKHDAGKSRPDLIPGEALLAVGAVLEYGARKYTEDSWRSVPDAEKRYRAAAVRHLCAILSGEETDPESGLDHWAHVACNALFVLALRAGK